MNITGESHGRRRKMEIMKIICKEVRVRRSNLRKKENWEHLRKERG